MSMILLHVYQKNKIQETLNKFNSYHQRLKFTFEIEQDNILPFLDVLGFPCNQ